MINISTKELVSLLPFERLIPTLREAFKADYTVPLRHHHDFANPLEGIDSTLLLMPAWETGKYLGVKMVTVSPNNSKYNLPSVSGIYILLDAHKGVPLAFMDAKTLTTKRTAAASALASSFLSRPDSSSLLMIGTGALAPQLIEAHAHVRPLKQVFVWGRNIEKAKAIAQLFGKASFSIQAIESIEEGISNAAIISCATLSSTPLVKGTWLKAGQHLDMVGAYKVDMREADDDVIMRAEIFVDNYESALKETGDLVIPLKNGILNRTDIRADLFELCRAKKMGRKNEKEITFFKSVGHALEDLAAAKLVFESYSK